MKINDTAFNGESLSPKVKEKKEQDSDDETASIIGKVHDKKYRKL